MSRKSTGARKMARVFAAALGTLLCASVHATPAADVDSAGALSAGAPFYGHLPGTLGGAVLPAQCTANVDEIRGRINDPGLVSFDGEAAQSAVLTAGASARGRGQVRALVPQYRLAGGSAPGLSSPLDTSLSDLPASFHYVLGSDLPIAGDRARDSWREVLLRNSDPLVRAKVRLNLGKEWLFMYADMGATDSALRWQGLVGIRVGQDARLLGGWRHVTYYLSPGSEFDSLDFDGPFLAAQRTW
jgi:hypothetical protein